ncbi:beta-lactamase family protein [bacterium]|nr:beta-lactamase family protein [bacterium]
MSNNKVGQYALKTLIGIFVILLLGVIGLVATGHKYILTAVSRTYFDGHSTANIDDYTAFETRVIPAANFQPWQLHEGYKLNALPSDFASHLESNDGVAFLVIQNGKLLAEQYFAGYGPKSKTNSFSMMKTVVTLLLGIAIEEGYIKGLDQPLIDFLPEFKEDENGQHATIGSLSTMTSGYEWDENYYSPFSPTVELLYGDDVENFLLKGKFSKPAESDYYYSSASTQLLAIAITRALQKRDPAATLSGYLSEKIWKPLGMNDDALWHLDNNKMELAYCCLNTNARNYAKLGQLMLQDGNWDEQQLVPSAFAKLMYTPHTVANYGYSTWINNDHQPNYYLFRGHLGQYIIVIPEHNLVVVRLGKTRGDGESDVDGMINRYVDEAVELISGK